MNPEVIQQRIEQLECLILKQDATIKEQQQQNVVLQNQIETHLQIMQQQKTEYDTRIQQAEALLQQHRQQYQSQSQSQHNTTFCLDTNQIINQFNQIKPFGPKNNLSSFIKTVENLITLCGNNCELQKFGIRIIKTQKFFGNVADSINLLADDASWEDIKTQLIKDLRPQTSYSSVINYCRSIKISNLNELFKVFVESKYKLNDSYLYDESRPDLYSPQNVDRDLTEILIDKIDGQFRSCIIDEEPTLDSLYRRFSQLKLLYDKRAIDFRSRKITNTQNNTNGHNEKKGTGKNFNNKQHFNKKSPNNFQTNYVQNKYASNPQSQQHENGPTPMDIGNLEGSAENEVNFLSGPQHNYYP